MSLPQFPSKILSSQTYFAQSDPNIPVSQVDDTNNFGLKVNILGMTLLAI